MKPIGILIGIVAVLALVLGFSMDTTVESRFGNSRVHNVGLMNEKQNIIIAASGALVAAALLIGLSGRSRDPEDDRAGEGYRTCPSCAERVRSEAKVCRYCQHELPSLAELAAQAERKREAESEDERSRAIEAQRREDRMPKGICPNCEKTIPLASKDCKYCGAVFGADSAWRVRPMDRA